MQCDVTSLDRIMNSYIRGSLEVTNMTGKMREDRLRWIGHIDRKNNEDKVKKIDEISVDGNRGEMEEDVNETHYGRQYGHYASDNLIIINDREGWRIKIKVADLTCAKIKKKTRNFQYQLITRIHLIIHIYNGATESCLKQ